MEAERIIDRLDKYMKAKNINDNQITVNCQLSVGLIGKARKGESDIGKKAIEKILNYYQDLSRVWLLTGEGEMCKKQFIKAEPDTTQPPANAGRPIPLVSQTAVAGFGNNDFAIAEQDVKEYYLVPKFKHCHIDFMIEVTGSSMYPKYNSGDVVACTIIRESRFIQWNKCHVIATKEQGILVKRLLPGDDSSHIKAVSDNKDYPPFDIPIDEITGIAIVAGVIRLE